MKTVVWFSLLLFLCAGHVRAQELPFTHYTPENDQNPLPSTAVTDVYQDRMGYVWMVIFSSGLIRYDGHSMERYTLSDGLRTLSVWRVLEDEIGRLWVVSDDGLMVSEEPLTAYENGRRIRFTSSIGEVSLTGDRVRANSVVIDDDGLLWVGTRSSGIIRYTTDDLQTTVVDTIRATIEGDMLPDIRSLALRKNGTILVGEARGKLLMLDRDASSFRTLVENTDPPGQFFSALYESPMGTLWVGRRDGGLYQLTGDAGNTSLVPVSDVLKHSIMSILQTADSTLWVSSEGSGVLRIDLQQNGKQWHYDQSNGLLSSSVHSIMQDREENIWFAQVGGVSKLRFDFDAFHNYSAKSYYGEKPRLPGPSVGAVIPSHNASSPCQIWAATSDGGIACIDEHGASVFIQSSHGLRHNWVNALAEDESGTLWIGTLQGIQSISFNSRPRPGGGVPTNVDLFGERARLTEYWPISVYSITRQAMLREAGSNETVESLWFAGFPYVVFLVEGKWHSFYDPAGLPRVRLHSVAFDDRGRLWVATQNQGIYRSVLPLTLEEIDRMQKEEIAMPLESGGTISGMALESPFFEQIWSVERGAPTDEFYDLLWLEGTMWAATPVGILGLETVPEGEADAIRIVAHLSEEDGIDAPFSMSLAHTPVTGTIWAGTNSGLVEIDPASKTVQRLVQKSDGLIDNEVWFIGSVSVDDDGTVYYGTAKGLTVYQEQQDRVNPVPPFVHMRKTSYVERAGQNELAAEYAALSFVNERLVKYKTRLAGYETEWSQEKTDTRIRYTSLSAFFLPKAYTLEVIAANNDGVWSETPALYRFRVKPPPWFRWWALLIYAMLFGAGLVAADHVQRVRLIRKERERAQIREAELKAEAAVAQSEAAEARARALQAENERKEIELEKARELEQAYDEVRKKHEENERLLLHILPPSIAERLKQGEQIIADDYREVTILFADLVDFTRLSSIIPAYDLVHLLNGLFVGFDHLALTYGVEKIKTIGDAYMAVAGLPEVRDDHAKVMAEVALEMLAVLERFNKAQSTRLQIRIGLNTGPAIAGVIGHHKFIYDLWGDAVNTAARMESHGVPGRIHVSAATKNRLDGLYEFDRRGLIEIKGKGAMETFLLRGRKQLESVEISDSEKIKVT